jgi:tight adherence protein B
MLEYSAMAFAFVAAAALMYLAVTQFYPPIRKHIRSEYLDIDQQLKNIFYTNYDGKLFVILKYGGSLAAFLVGMFMFNSFIFGLFMAVIVYVIPGILLKRIVNGRRDALEDQTSDVMTALNATVKSGMTLEESIGEIAATMKPPVAQEFALIKERIDAGQTIVAALRAADKRLEAPRLSQILQSLIVSQERGGRLATLMEKLSVAMREIERVEERIKTETSGLRLSSRIMVFIPFVICGFLYLAEPEQVTMLFTTFVGNVILVIAIGLDILAFRSMQKIIDLDV